MILKINGDIASNDLQEVYEWFGYECTTPKMVKTALESLPEGETLDVKINSGGGDVFAGQEIYSMLRGRNDVEIEIESMAASAASVIAMANHCTISPVGMIMIHNVSICGTEGNKNDLRETAEVLDAYDNALAEAYCEKTGYSKADILKMMNDTTWLTAKDAVSMGFVDGITERAQAIAASFGMTVTPSMVESYKAQKAEAEAKAKLKADLVGDLDKFGI